MLTRRAFAATALAVVGTGCRQTAPAPGLVSITGGNLTPLQQQFNSGAAEEVRVLTLLSPT